MKTRLLILLFVFLISISIASCDKAAKATYSKEKVKESIKKIRISFGVLIIYVVSP